MITAMKYRKNSLNSAMLSQLDNLATAIVHKFHSYLSSGLTIWVRYPRQLMTENKTRHVNKLW